MDYLLILDLIIYQLYDSFYKRYESIIDERIIMKQMSIIEGRLDEFVREFMRNYYPKGDYPQWCIDAFKVAGISLS